MINLICRHTYIKLCAVELGLFFSFLPLVEMLKLFSEKESDNCYFFSFEIKTKLVLVDQASS